MAAGSARCLHSDSLGEGQATTGQRGRVGGFGQIAFGPASRAHHACRVQPGSAPAPLPYRVPPGTTPIYLKHGHTFARWRAGGAQAPPSPNFQTGMPIFFALSATLAEMPEPGKTSTPIGRTSSMASLRLNGAAFA